MKYRIHATWNGSPVVAGECSAVMAHAITRALADNYVNPDKAGVVLPTLEDLVNAPVGAIIEGYGDDGTGRMVFCLGAQE